MQKVLVIGATSYIGAHVVDTLLRQKYQVIASMEQISQSEFYRDKYPDEENLAFVTLSDLNSDTELQRIMKFNHDIDHVICLSQPDITGDCDKDLDRATTIMKNVIKAVDRHGHEVQTMVITSSFAAMINDPPRFDDCHKIYTSRDVNQITREQAKQDRWSQYLGIKSFAETACWTSYSEMFPPPRFSLTTIALPLVFGPPIHNLEHHDFRLQENLDSISTTSSANNNNDNNNNTNNNNIDDSSNHYNADYLTNCLLNFAYKSIDLKKLDTKLPVPFVVDVRDAAMAHVRAIQLPPQTNRWFVANSNVCAEHVLETAKHELKNNNKKNGKKDSKRVAEYSGVEPKSEIFLDQQCGFDTTDSDDAAGIQYTPFNITVKETYEKLMSFKSSL